MAPSALGRTLLAAAAGLFGVLAAGSAGAQSVALQVKADDLPAILGEVRAGGRARVIVTFEAPDEPVESAADLERRRDRVRFAQNAILAAALGGEALADLDRGARRLQRMQLEPMFALAAGPDELDRLAADLRVRRIQPDRFEALQLTRSVRLIGMPAVRAAGGRGEGQMVAVIDTGVNGTHPFLAGRVEPGACFATNDDAYESTCPGGAASSFRPDAAEPCTGSAVCDHGTHVAGIVAGHGDGADGPRRGVAPKARILPIKVFSRRRGSGAIGAFVSDQIKALEYVFARRALSPVPIAAVNMSLGGSPQPGFCNDDARTPIIRRLRRAGIATVIASGNESALDGVSTPGCIAAAITVGATTGGDRIAWFGNFGPAVDLLAPGEAIVSSVGERAFRAESGTSMAAPHVAGAIAALRSLRPRASVAELEQALERTGVPVTDQRSGGTLARPRIQVDRALEALGGAERPDWLRASGADRVRDLGDLRRALGGGTP